MTSPVVDESYRKVCSHCKELLPASVFYVRRASKDGLHNWCKPCHNERQKNRPYAQVRGYKLKQQFGISLADYREMLEAQGSACAICRTTDAKGRGTFHVDHNHDTGVVRGLLCANCNVGIGNLQESVVILREAIAYLERHAA